MHPCIWHRLIGIGDDVGGDTLTQIRYFGGGINSFGDVAFAGELEGGDPLFTVRAARVQGVMEPGSLALRTVGGLALRGRQQRA